MFWEPDPTMLYKPLPDVHIRVLQLQGPCVIDVPERPGVQDIAIQCSLVAVPLIDPADYSHGCSGANYTALSYVWGNASEAFRQYVLCDGVIWPITMSLFTALRQVHLDPDPQMRTLWVDAICINQSDDTEKGKQIAMMGDIYIHASQVLIWLGAGMELRGQQHEKFWKHASGMIPEQLAEDAIIQVGNFVRDHEWLQRAWAFQEIVLAKRPLVQLGPYRVSWDRLREALSKDPKLKGIEACRESGGYQSLLKLIQITWHRQATDKRDKIYSLLGVYQGSGRLRVDLKRSVPQVTADTLAVICSDLGHLAFLDLLDLEGMSFRHFSVVDYALFKVTEGWNKITPTAHMFQGDRDCIEKGRIKKPVDFYPGQSWVFDWSRRPKDLNLQLRLAHDGRVSGLDFGSFNPKWIMDWKLKDSNIVVAGALCGVFVSRIGHDLLHDQTYIRTLKPVKAHCMSTIPMTDLHAWSNSKKRTQSDRNMQFERDFFSSNEFYQRYVQEHCMERSCTCRSKARVEIEKAAGKLSSFFKKGTSIPPDQTRTTDTAQDGQQSSEQTSYKQEPLPRIYLAALFGAKSLVIVQPFWDSKQKCCTFRIRTRIKGSHCWTKLFFKLANCVPFEVGTATDGFDSDGEITVDELQKWNDLEKEFLSMSFVPMHFEFQHTDLEKNMYPAQFRAEMLRMKGVLDSDFFGLSRVDI